MLSKKRISNKTVVVLGLPRSGTSLTCAILEILGVEVLGDKDSTYINPSGTYEDMDFVRLDYEILKSAGDNGYWSHPPNRKEILKKEKYFSEKIKKLFESKLQGREIIAFKHPPNSLTIELYLRHLKSPHIIFVERKIADVAVSCKNSFPELKELTEEDLIKILTWHKEGIEKLIERNSHVPSIGLKYEEIIENPAKQAYKLTRFLGIKLTPDAKADIYRLVVSGYKIKLAKNKAKLIRTSAIIGIYVSEVMKIFSSSNIKLTNKLNLFKLLNRRYYEVHIRKNRLYNSNHEM